MENITKSYSIMTRITSLVVALLIYTTSVTIPALQPIAAAFPEASETLVKAISTIPSLMMCVFSLVTGWMTSRLSLKKCVLIACCLITLGAIPAFFGGIYVVLVTRVFFGAGYGMVMVLSSAIITSMFEGSARDTMMGWKTAVGAVAGIVLPILGGALAVANWRYAFLGLLLTVPVGLLVWFFLPDTGVKGKKQKAEGRLKGSLLLVAAATFLFNILYFTFMVEMSFVVVGEGLGTAAQAGSVLSTFSALTVVSGFAYAFSAKVLKQTMPAVAALLMGVGILIALYAPSLAVLYGASAVFGVGFGFMNPSFTLLSASCVTHPSRSPMAISVNVCATGIGQFVSPYVMAFLKNALGLRSLRADWQIAGYVITVCAALCILLLALFGKKKPRPAR